MSMKYRYLVKLICTANGAMAYTRIVGAVLFILAVACIAITPLAMMLALLAAMFTLGFGLLAAPFGIRILFASPNFLFIPDFRRAYLITLLGLAVLLSLYLWLLRFWLNQAPPPLAFGLLVFSCLSILLWSGLKISVKPVFQYVWFFPLLLNFVSPPTWLYVLAILQPPWCSGLLTVITLLGWTVTFRLTRQHLPMQKPFMPLWLDIGKGQPLFNPTEQINTIVADARSAVLVLLHLPGSWFSIALPLFAVPILPVLLIQLKAERLGIEGILLVYLSTMVLTACASSTDHIRAISWIRTLWLRTSANRQQLWQEQEGRVWRLFGGVVAMVQISMLLALCFHQLQPGFYYHLSALLMAGLVFTYYLGLITRLLEREWLMSVGFLPAVVVGMWAGFQSIKAQHHTAFILFILIHIIVALWFRTRARRIFTALDCQILRPLETRSRQAQTTAEQS